MRTCFTRDDHRRWGAGIGMDVQGLTGWGSRRMRASAVKDADWTEEDEKLDDGAEIFG